jgi:hypothetical protein
MTIIDILVWARVMVFNATLNNISAISWHSVLFVEETGVLGENHRSRSPISTSHALNGIIGLITFAGNVFYCPRIPILELFLNDVSSIISRE